MVLAEVLTYLVEAKEAQVSHNIQGTDPGPCGDLSSHLQTDFNDLQRIGENHLGTSSLQDAEGEKTEQMSGSYAQTDVGFIRLSEVTHSRGELWVKI